MKKYLDICNSMGRILFSTHSTYSQRVWVSHRASEKREHVCIAERDYSGMFLATCRGGGGRESTGNQGLPGNCRVTLSINPLFLHPDESSFIHSLQVLPSKFYSIFKAWEWLELHAEVDVIWNRSNPGISWHPERMKLNWLFQVVGILAKSKVGSGTFNLSMEFADFNKCLQEITRPHVKAWLHDFLGALHRKHRPFFHCF